MDFSREDLKHIVGELTDTGAILAADPAPGAFRELAPRLKSLSYELETLAIYADSLPAEDISEILSKTKEVQERLQERVETGNYLDEVKKSLFDELSLFSEVIAKLAYLV